MKDNDITSDCKRFLGIYPYNSPTNICEGDIFFLVSLYMKYGTLPVMNKMKELQRGEQA